MAILPPGTLLQLMYLRERLSQLPAGRFIEVGPGAGHTSALLLSLGWQGEAYDLEQSTVETLQRRFAREIESGKYRVVHGDWLASSQSVQSDLVISCMVMEHFDDEAQQRFLSFTRSVLKPAGVMISIVPGSPDHWGIEDDIAGHVRRYTRDSAVDLFTRAGWVVRHTAGLTFPISNILLPLSNFLVRRSEARKLSLSMLERTKQSGIRDVPMKTTFPRFLGLFLNERAMYPLHVLQKWKCTSDAALVLYIEATPTGRGF
ncbi:class I SAM-dependent methyltransferase [Paraburkholderia sediminicola]|uniref:class I SAM-dependent methyltransferase n=1 Tax=Paraburkholderia sediminicola TaxID=458836 RepID=UPI0038BC6E58